MQYTVTFTGKTNIEGGPCLSEERSTNVSSTQSPIRGRGINQLPRSHNADMQCNSRSQYEELRGRQIRLSQMCQLWISEGRPGFEPRVNPAVFLQVIVTCAKSAFLEVNLCTSRRRAPAYVLPLQSPTTVENRQEIY